MGSSYKKMVQELYGKDVNIERADAPILTGTVAKVKDGGCVIRQPGSRPGANHDVFVAYEDIRGVGSDDWDYDNI